MDRKSRRVISQKIEEKWNHWWIREGHYHARSKNRMHHHCQNSRWTIAGRNKTWYFNAKMLQESLIENCNLVIRRIMFFPILGIREERTASRYILPNLAFSKTSILSWAATHRGLSFYFRYETGGGLCESVSLYKGTYAYASSCHDFEDWFTWGKICLVRILYLYSIIWNIWLIHH